MSFDEKQLAAGIRRMRKDAEAKIEAGAATWPPIPFEFACWCKAKSSLYFPSAQKSLLPPMADKAKAESEVKKMRGLLK